MEDKPNNDEIEKIQLDWLNIRLNDLKSQPGYNGLSEEQKLLVFDGLKAEIIRELNLDSSSDNMFTGEELVKLSGFDKQRHFTLDGKTNLADISTNSVGYDKITERSADPANQYSIGHESIFEQALAEYFIEKRKDYSHSQQLLDQLDKKAEKSNFGIFEQKEF